MSDPSAAPRPVSVEAYLAFEEASPARHEYAAGEVYARRGATLRHYLICSYILVHLHAAARGAPCRIYVEAVKLRAADDVIHYPDVMADCTPGDEPLDAIHEDIAFPPRVSEPADEGPAGEDGPGAG